MKKFVTRILPWILIAAMLVLMLPAVSCRVVNESRNKNVVVSLLYNSVRNSVSSEKLEEVLDKALEIGVNTVSVMEDDVNSLVARGEVTCIKLNVLLHKYDIESMLIAQAITENYPQISYDAFLLLSRRPKTTEKLDRFIGMKYTEDEFFKLEGIEGIDVYAYLNGRDNLWDVSLGYDEAAIAELRERGFEPALVHTVRNNSVVEYIDYIDNIVKKYDIKYLNIKQAGSDVDPAKAVDENFKGIARIVEENNMTLVVTENVDQLSNQKTFGYGEIFGKAISEKGSKKVMRSYETYDDSHADDTHYKYRANQFYNSTIDRNIRFITVTLQAPKGLTYNECADYSLMAAEDYINRISAEGYTVNSPDGISPVDYPNPGKAVSACAAFIMVIMALLLAEMLWGKYDLRLSIAAYIAAVLAFCGTFVLPDAIVSLYPSVYCIAASCFAITVLLRFVKDMKEGVKIFPAILASVAVLISVLCLTMLGMGALLSGIDYYINNEIFRGIKVSLIVPPVYTLAAFAVIFMGGKDGGLFSVAGIKNVLTANIKVYWVIIAALLGGAGMYYIIRSGNVNSISAFEQTMRNVITEVFPARPRTKEFLIGYPCLVLLVYYARKTDYKLIQWGLAVGMSILAASVTNSFCHVFTSLSTIYMRVVNGLIIGVFTGIAVYVANVLVLKLFYIAKEKTIKLLEKTNG